MLKYLLTLFTTIKILQGADVSIVNLSALNQISVPFPYTNVLLLVTKTTTNGSGQLTYTGYKMTPTFANLEAITGTDIATAADLATLSNLVTFTTQVGLTNQSQVLKLMLSAGTNIVYTTNGNTITINSAPTNAFITQIGLTNDTGILLLRIAAGTNTVFTTNGNLVTISSLPGVNSTGSPIAGSLTVYPGTSPTNIVPNTNIVATGTNLSVSGGGTFNNGVVSNLLTVNTQLVVGAAQSALVTWQFGANITNASTSVVVTNDIDWRFNSNVVFIGNVRLPTAAAPTTAVFGDIAGDNNAWAASHGTLQFFDGTANVFVVATTATDIPTNGQIPKWNTGGTVTWEDQSAPGTVGTMINTTTTAVGTVPYALDTTKTNWAPSGAIILGSGTNAQVIGNITMNGLVATNTATIPALFGSDGTTRLNVAYTVYAAGTAYSLTATPAALDFGTTDPSLTISTPGTYIIRARVNLKYNAATFAAVRTVTLKLRRTNNTAADLTNGSDTFSTDIITTKTYTAGWLNLPEITYTTGNSNDAITIFGDVSVIPTAGSIDTISASIVALRAYE